MIEPIKETPGIEPTQASLVNIPTTDPTYGIRFNQDVDPATEINMVIKAIMTEATTRPVTASNKCSG